MKIITKMKDYYDYMVGTYGMDPLTVYDRRNIDSVGIEYPNKDGYDSRTFFICGTKYKIYYYRGDIYHTEDELLVLNDRLKRNGYDGILSNWRRNSSTIVHAHFRQHNGNTDNNDVHGEPILMYKDTYWDYNNGSKNTRDKFVVPLLREYGLARYITANEMFQNVYSFLSKLKDKEVPNNQTDIEKVVSHGFDKKISFRHRK